MNNPWKALNPDADQYVLKEDFGCLQLHNLTACNSTKFMTRSIPEPFIGNPKSARIVFLGKNPGHSEGDGFHHANNFDLRKAMFRNLSHALDEYAFYPLNPAFADTGVGRWWRKRTKELQQAAGLDLTLLAARMMVIEWFPYHSVRFITPKGKCESQKYSFDLAKTMLDRAVLVVGMRARSLWIGADSRFGKVPFLKNPQCGYISRGNTNDGLFARIIDALKS